jgi:hypothetical protein
MAEGAGLAGRMGMGHVTEAPGRLAALGKGAGVMRTGVPTFQRKVAGRVQHQHQQHTTAGGLAVACVDGGGGWWWR